MNWEAIGALGELIGAVAVLITVLYLVIQVRQNNKLLEAQHREMNRIAVRDINRSKSESREFSELMAKSRNAPQDLDDIDMRRVRSQLQDEILAYQSMYLRAKLMDEKRMIRVSVLMMQRVLEEHEIAREMFSDGWDLGFKEAVDNASDT